MRECTLDFGEMVLHFIFSTKIETADTTETGCTNCPMSTGQGRKSMISPNSRVGFKRLKMAVIQLRNTR